MEGLSASWTDPNGVAQRQFTFPNGVTDIAVPWNTKANTPGIYTFIAKIYQSTGALSGGAVEIAARQAGLTIDAMQAIESVKLSPLPAFSNLGATAPIKFSLDVVNRSNIPTSMDVMYQLKTPSGAVVSSGMIALPLLPPEGSKTIILDGPQYTFTESGSYPSAIQISNGPNPTTAFGNAIIVASGIRIDPSQQITPFVVTPDGDKRIRINIRLQGVEQK